MATLTPIDGDPFSVAPAQTAGPRLTPVDDDPFAAPPIATADPARTLLTGAPAQGRIGSQGGTRTQRGNVQEDFWGSLLQGHDDAQIAYRQRASALVRDVKGNYVRPVIGEVENYDFGPMVRRQDGSLVYPNSDRDVVLRDPATGKLVAFERDAKIDNPDLINRVGTFLLPGMVAGPPSAMASSNAVPMAVQRGASLGFPVSARSAQAGERLRDASALAELGLADRFFPPAFRSKGAAGFAQTVENMPIIGGVVREPRAATERALAETQASIANRLGAAPTDEAAGHVLQSGLERFRTAGISRIEPRVLEGIEQARPDAAFSGPMPNIPARAPVPRAPLMSGEAAQRATQAAPVREELGGGIAQTTRGVPIQAARPLEQTLVARRNAADLGDGELQALIRAPARDTSFASRQEALFEQAWRSIPAQFRIDASRNPQRLAATNTRAALGSLDASIANQIGGQTQITGGLADRLRNARSHFSMDDLRSIRTEVGRSIGTLNPFQSTLNGSQLKQLYGALSRDIEIGLMDLANRAYLQTRVSGNRPDRVAVEAARRADRALREFRVADRYTRLGMARMDRFSRVLGADSPEGAMRTLATRMKEGTIDRGTVRAIAEALRPEERGQVLGYLVSRMGQGRPGAQESERIWSASAFATDWNKNKVALEILSRGVDPSIRRSLNLLAQAGERQKFYETTRNYSGSAYAGIPALTAMSAIGAGSATGFLTLLAQVGGVAAIGKFLTTPRYLDWMTKAGLQGGKAPKAQGRQVGGSMAPAVLDRLRYIAANDNELGPVVSQTIDLFNRRGVAGEQERSEGQRQ